MTRTPFVVPPGKNPILAAAWKAHKAAQRADGKKKPEPEPEPVKAKKGRR